MYKFIYVYCVLLISVSFVVFAQVNRSLPSQATPMVLSPRVGIEMDSTDVHYFRLFHTIKHIHAVRAFTSGSDTLVFQIKRTNLSDTLVYSTRDIGKHLAYYIENIEHISNKSVAAKIPASLLAPLAHVEDYKDRKYKAVSMSIIKRDRSEIHGTLLLITDNAILIHKRTDTYTWKTVQDGLQYVYFNEIDRIVGASIRYFRGNEELVGKYLLSEYSTTENTSFFMVSDHEPIPSEVRHLIRTSTPTPNGGYASIDSLRSMKPTGNALTLSISVSSSYPEYLTQHNLDWGNQYDSRTVDSYANSLYFPLDITAGYAILKDNVTDTWSLSCTAGLVVNSNIVFSDNTWLIGRGGLQFHYNLQPLDRLYRSGSDVGIIVGIDALSARFSGIFKREQASDELPLDNVLYPLTLHVSAVLANIGVQYRYHLSDDLCVSLQAIANFTVVQSPLAPEKLIWGRYGRNFYKSVDITAPDFSLKFGTSLSYTL